MIVHHRTLGNFLKDSIKSDERRTLRRKRIDERAIVFCWPIHRICGGSCGIVEQNHGDSSSLAIPEHCMQEVPLAQVDRIRPSRFAREHGCHAERNNDSQTDRSKENKRRIYPSYSRRTRHRDLEWIDDLQLLDDRARPPVRDDERQRIFMFRTNVNEMNVQPIDLGHEIRQEV